MAQSKQALRARIKSVNSTRKITKAMEMIANAKLFRQRNRMEANREYAVRLQDTVNEIIVKNPNLDSPFLKTKNESAKKFSVVFCSDLGLCGAYNQNILRLAKDMAEKDDPMYVIGTSLYGILQELGYNIRNEQPISSDRLTFQELESVINEGIHAYLEGEVGFVQVLYITFVNTMTFRAQTNVLLPCQLKEEAESNEETNHFHVETMFEPDVETILDQLVPMMIENVAYSNWMEATTSEQGSRRMAMKTATDNADELSESLLLEYNKARQASITQEITEIVGGSNAV